MKEDSRVKTISAGDELAGIILGNDVGVGAILSLGTQAENLVDLEVVAEVIDCRVHSGELVAAVVDRQVKSGRR